MPIRFISQLCGCFEVSKSVHWLKIGWVDPTWPHLFWKRTFFGPSPEKSFASPLSLQICSWTWEHEWSQVTSSVLVTACFGRVHVISLATTAAKTWRVHYMVCRKQLWSWFSVFFQSAQSPTHPPTSILILDRKKLLWTTPQSKVNDCLWFSKEPINHIRKCHSAKIEWKTISGDVYTWPKMSKTKKKATAACGWPWSRHAHSVTGTVLAGHGTTEVQSHQPRRFFL